MKELSIEQKAKAYDEAYKKVAVRFGSNVADEIFPELKESEDERIRKEMIEFFTFEHWDGEAPFSYESAKERIAWLEKQGEHAKFRDSIQVGDKVTRNRDGVLVNLSQLKRVAKPAENKGEHDMGISEATKQKLEDKLHEALEKETPESFNEFLDEQKPADKVEPKFHEGDMIIHKELGGDYIHNPHKIIQVDILDKKYRLEGGLVAHFGEQDDYELVEQKHAWTEEDENRINRLIAYFEDKESFTAEDDIVYAKWLKSLKERYTWKPNDVQMHYLSWIANVKLGDSMVEQEVSKHLNELLEDLKKLREA